MCTEVSEYGKGEGKGYKPSFKTNSSEPNNYWKLHQVCLCPTFDVFDHVSNFKRKSVINIIFFMFRR